MISVSTGLHPSETSSAEQNEFENCKSRSDPGDLAGKIEACWRNRESSAQVIDCLISWLLHDAADVRWRAAIALGDIGEGARRAVPVLITRLVDNNYYVRLHSFRALGRIQPCYAPLDVLVETVANHSNPLIRWSAAEFLSELGDPSAAAVLACSLRNDADSDVRREAAAFLGSVGIGASNSGFILNALDEALRDNDATVRVEAATRLTDAQTDSTKALTALVEALTDETVRITAWSALMHAIRKNSKSTKVLTGIPACVVDELLPEALAQGVLQTVGIKAWNQGPRVTIPAHMAPGDRKPPWEDLGVYQSWLTCCRTVEGGSQVTSKQICIHSDVLDGLHLVAISQLILHSERTPEAASAPAEIEGKPVGFMIHGGGVLRDLRGMRRLCAPVRATRVDFLAGYEKNVRAIQLLVSSRLRAVGDSPSHQVRNESHWRHFERRMRRILERHGLAHLATQEWFEAVGWRSLRYGRRYEASYDAVRMGLSDLFSVLNSKKAPALIQAVAQLTDLVLRDFEAHVVTEGRCLLPLPLARRAYVERSPLTSFS